MKLVVALIRQEQLPSVKQALFDAQSTNPDGTPIESSLTHCHFGPNGKIGAYLKHFG